MKNSHFIKNVLGLGSVLTLAIGLTSSAFAGPSSQFVAQQEKNRANLAKKTEAAKPADASAMTCPNCKTTEVRVDRTTGANGRLSVTHDFEGTKHACATCGGAITVIRGTTTNDMKGNCPICAKAAPGCCGVKGQVVAAN